VAKVDEIFISTCKDILENGQWVREGVRPKWADTGEDACTIKKFAVVNRYNLAEEFPILTLRNINFKAAIDEILWIWQKKSNKISELNSKIWDAWELPDGTIGKDYGWQLAQKSKYKEGEFDQVDRVLYDLTHTPTSRRIITNMYNHKDLHEMALYPCAYMMTFNVTGNRLNAILNQRSQDTLVANNWNVCQYAALVHLFARSSGLEVGELVHVIADCHIYDRHIDLVKTLIARKPHKAAKFTLSDRIGKGDFYKATVDDFILEDYESGEKITGIPVAV
jgi:thymidylate synthase